MPEILYLAAVYAFSNGENAGKIIGQPNFTTNTAATTQNGLLNPTVGAFDSSGNLWVTDTSNNRVLEYKPPFSNGKNAALVIGQPDFTTGTAATTQSDLFDPEGVALDKGGNLWVVDMENSRVLEFPAVLSTSTKVTSKPNSVLSSSATTCTATVSYKGGGTPVTPTGTVTWTSNLTGTFNSTSCTLSGSGSSASCAVMFTPPFSSSGIRIGHE